MRHSFLWGSRVSLLMLVAACGSKDTPGDGSTTSGGNTTGGNTTGGNTTGGNTTGGNTTGGNTTGGNTTGSGAGGGNGTTGGTGSGGTSSTTGTGAGGMSGGANTDGGSVVDCPTDTNLVNTPSCWVGCDPTLTTDNPQGIQGAFYGFGDGTTCTVPDSVCSSKGVCMTGTTAVDPTYAKFGCGIGMELNATGGTTSVKQAYAGPTKCFDYELTGSSGGNEVRIAFTQSADTAGKVSPYVSIPAFTNGHTGTVCFADVTCQGQTKCTLGTTDYDLQVTVAGGKQVGMFNLCLSKLVPQGSGKSTYSQICGKPGATDGAEDIGKYFAQNNVNHDPGGTQCITPGLTADAASFTIDSSNLSDQGDSTPSAFPSIVDGWHYGRTSSDAKLPKQVSALTTVTSAVTFSGSNGKYNASYDLWVLPTGDKTATTPSGGLEIMLWLNYSNVQPAGSKVGTFNGWDVWTSNVQNWKYVAYVKNGMTSFNDDLAPFIKDAVSRQGFATSSYLMGIEFGFELYQSGPGFKVSSFTSTVN